MWGEQEAGSEMTPLTPARGVGGCKTTTLSLHLQTTPELTFSQNSSEVEKPT